MRRILPMLVLLLLSAGPLAAAPLYTGEVAVERGSQGRAQDALAALDQVLARLTGRFDVSLVEELALDADDLNELVLSRQLVRREVVDGDGEADEALRLQVEFDQPSIDELLRRSGLPRWGRERPAILVWAVVEDDSGARFLTDPRLEHVLAEQARRVGLELVRPLQDALDLAEVSVQDVRGGFLGSARESARRYDAGVIAMLDLRLLEPGSEDEESRWSGRWRWRVEQQDSGFDQSGRAAEALIEAGLEQLASALAARYGAIETDGAPARWRLSVEGIVDEVQYAEVLRYLENLSVVEDVRVVAARERELIFEITAGGDRIESLLTLGGLIEPRSRAQGNRLFYRLAP